eukprot:gene14837-14973_t
MMPLFNILPRLVAKDAKLRPLIVISCLAAALMPATAMAKDTKFWNLTNNTITVFELSPAGKDQWGKNQTANDSDGSVDHDERLKITNITSGAYDVRFTDKTGRTCSLTGCFLN